MEDDKLTPEEVARKYGIPLIPPLPIPPAAPNHDFVAVCGQCGLKLTKIMSYTCTNNRCPTGLGPIYSMNTGV